MEENMNLRQMTLAALMVAASSPALAWDNSKTSANSMYESTTVTFNAGSSTLSSDEADKIRSAVSAAKAKGTISRVEVAVWSDKDHSATRDLAKADRDLANERISTVKD